MFKGLFAVNFPNFPYHEEIGFCGRKIRLVYIIYSKYLDVFLVNNRCTGRGPRHLLSWTETISTVTHAEGVSILLR